MVPKSERAVSEVKLMATNGASSDAAADKSKGRFPKNVYGLLFNTTVNNDPGTCSGPWEPGSASSTSMPKWGRLRS